VHNYALEILLARFEVRAPLATPQLVAPRSPLAETADVRRINFVPAACKVPRKFVIASSRQEQRMYSNDDTLRLRIVAFLFANWQIQLCAKSAVCTRRRFRIRHLTRCRST
jgi:hypothetical protein